MKEEILQIGLDKIDFAPQVREIFNEEAIAGLASNIEEAGQLVPVLLFPVGDRYGIEDGERRCRAKLLLKHKTVSAIVKEKPSEAKLLLRQCSVDFQRVDLTAMEKALAINHLMEATGWKGNEIAAKLGISPAMVTRLQALLTLPEWIQQGLKEQKIPGSAGYELAKFEDSALQAEIGGKLMKGEMTRDEVMGVRKAARRESNGKPQAAPKRLTAVLGAGRSVTVATADDTLDDFIAVLEEALKKAKKGQSLGFGLDTLLRMLRDQAEVA